MALNTLAQGLLPFAFPGLPFIRCVFTTRATGNMSLYRADVENEDSAAIKSTRANTLASLGQKGWTELKQVHGDRFLIDPPFTAIDANPLLEADGLATSRKSHVLCIKTADCQPILLAHPAGYVAAVHAGWRGNVLAFPASAATTFCHAYNLEPSEVRAVRGPSLGYAEFTNFDREWPATFSPWYDPKTQCMDLWALTRSQLQDAGLKPEHIYGLDMCTYSLNATFFSHRKKDTGRQAGLIWMS